MGLINLQYYWQCGMEWQVSRVKGVGKLAIMDLDVRALDRLNNSIIIN